MGNVRSFEPGTPAWVDLDTVVGTTAASQFYCGLFGWRVVAQHRPIEDSAGYWIFQQDGLDVGGLGPNRQSGWVVHMSVADADATTRAVLDNGGSVLVFPMEIFDAGVLAVYDDPLGARFAVWEPRSHTGADIMDEPNSHAWSELSCRDPEEAKRFYNAVFGWEASTHSSADGPGYTEFSLPGGKPFAGMLHPGEEAAAAPPRWMVYFAVADTDRIAARAAELGGRVDVEPYDMPEVGRIAVLRDAEGSIFSVVQAR